MKNILLPNVLAVNISKVVVRNNPEFMKNSDEIRYGLEWIISGMNQVILVSLTAWHLHILPETMAALAAGALLRMFSGGAHFKNYFICLVFSTFQILVIGYMCRNYYSELVDKWPVILVMLFGSLILTVIKSPFLQKKKELFNSQREKMQKFYAVVIFLMVTFSSFTLAPSIQFSILMALIIQSISLTTTWEKGVNFFDAFLYKISEGRMRND